MKLSKEDLEVLYNFKLYYPIKNIEIINQVYIGDFETVFTLSVGRKVLFDELACAFMEIRPNTTGILLDEDWRKEFKRKIRKKISLSRKTQKVIADELGISENTLSNYANGKSIPDARIINRMARCFKCSADELTNFDYLL